MGIKSVEFVALAVFTVGIGLYFLWEPVDKWVLLAELSLWLTLQFFCHEYYTYLAPVRKS